MADAYWLDDSSSAAGDSVGTYEGITCQTCGASNFYTDGGQTFCSSCFTQSQGQSQIIEEDDAANLGARSSRGGLVRAQTPKTRRRKVVVDESKRLPKIDVALQYLFDAMEVMTKEAVLLSSPTNAQNTRPSPLSPNNTPSNTPVIVAQKLSTKILSLYLRSYKTSCSKYPTSTFTILESFLPQRTLFTLNKKNGENPPESLHELTHRKSKKEETVLRLLPSLQLLVSITTLTLKHLNYGVSPSILNLWIIQNRLPYKSLGGRIRVGNRFLWNFFNPKDFPVLEEIEDGLKVLEEVFYGPMNGEVREGICEGNRISLGRRIGKLLNFNEDVVERFEVLNALINQSFSESSYESSDDDDLKSERLRVTCLLLISYKMLNLTDSVVYDTKLYSYPMINNTENANRTVLNGKSYDIFEKQLPEIQCNETQCERELIGKVKAHDRKLKEEEKKSLEKVERCKVLAWTVDVFEKSESEGGIEEVKRSNLMALANSSKYYIRFTSSLDTVPTTYSQLITSAAQFENVPATHLWSTLQKYDQRIEEIITGRKINNTTTKVKKENAVRISHCGICEGCLTPECGECMYCLDSVKFGGPGIKRQRCKLRQCVNRSKEPTRFRKERLKVESAEKIANRITQPCGECVNCEKEDCGECVYCRDMVKFGGGGKRKRRCEKRRCVEIEGGGEEGGGMKCAGWGRGWRENLEKFFTNTEMKRKFPRCKECVKERREKKPKI